LRPSTKPRFGEPLAETNWHGRAGGDPTVEKTDNRHRRLLRPRRKRPRRRAAEKGDELASFQMIELHSIPASLGRIAGYRIGEDQSGGNGTILQPVSR
jgi:hypothetical protein